MCHFKFTKNASVFCVSRTRKDGFLTNHRLASNIYFVRWNRPYFIVRTVRTLAFNLYNSLKILHNRSHDQREPGKVKKPRKGGRKSETSEFKFGAMPEPN